MKIKTSRQGAGNPLLLQMLSDGELMRVELSLVDRDENQPRAMESVMEGIVEFATEIKRDGLIQYPVYNIKDNGRFTIVVGERRTAAFRINNEESIPAICKKFTQDEVRQIWEIQYAENDTRNNKPLKPLEDAMWWQNYMDMYCGGSIEQAAAAREVSKSYIYQKIGILKATPELIEFVKESINDYSSAYELAILEAADYDKAHAWINEFKSGNIDNLRGSIKGIKQKQKQESKPKKPVPPIVKVRPGRAEPASDVAVLEKPKPERDTDIPAETPTVGNVAIPGRVRPVSETVITAQGVSKVLLDEKLLLTLVTRGDFAGLYLADAFLSVSKRTPFQHSLHDIANLDDVAYQLFFQILDLSENTSRHESWLARLEKKIATLLE